MDQSRKQSTQILGILDQCKASETYQLLSQALDSKINDCRLQYVKEWEGDHSTYFAPFKSKIAALEIQKTQLRQSMLETVDSPADSVIQFGSDNSSFARNITY